MNHNSRITRFIFILAMLLALALIIAVATVIAQETVDVFISDIDYDPITDPLDEFVEITNGQAQSVDMMDWVLGDDNGNTYTFPTFSLAAGSSVRVWTGAGSDDSNNLYWGRSEPVWDDISECAYLRDGLGIDSNLIDSLCYPEPPSVQFALVNYSVSEIALTASISVTLSSASDTSVSVDYQTSDGTADGGLDYLVASDTITFTVGETAKTFEITILDDLSVEGDETVNLELLNPAEAVLGTPSNAVLTIIDNDEPEPTATNTLTASPTSTPTPTDTPTPTGTSTQTPTLTPTATSTLAPTQSPGQFVYAPIILRSIFAPSTPAPTATPSPTGTTIPTSTPTPAICNGNFEQGQTCWLEVSTNGFDLVTNDFQGVLNPHNGSWAAWLGGYPNETSAIYQQISVPTGSPKLFYWYWIASGDVCGYDVGGVAINEDAVDGYWLCASTNTGGWVQRTVDLSAYAGQTVTLYFLADTDGTLNSSLFIDDVQIQK